jgi:hypothetical protein
MIELLIAACLSSAATECRDFSLLYDPYEMSLIACTLHGQQHIAQWHQTHPGWTVSRWTCGYRSPGAADI